jgi:hypothetical protein
MADQNCKTTVRGAALLAPKVDAPRDDGLQRKPESGFLVSA